MKKNFLFAILICFAFAITSCTAETPGLGDLNTGGQGQTDDDDDTTNPDGGTTNPDGGTTNPDGGTTTPDDQFDPATVAAAIKSASQYMNDEVYTITNKAATPPQGHSKNYYVSMGPYWWPNENTADGLPYVNKDGKVNPESRTDYTDFATLTKLCNAVISVANAYYYTKEDLYVTRVQNLIVTFFINPTTQMLPNLEHGQLIPGLTDGRADGIIETAAFPALVLAIDKVAASPAWAPEVDAAFRKWMADYTNWLITSDIGKQECAKSNNHGTHYDRQILAYYAFLKETKGTEYLNTVTIPRIKRHAAADGSQPEELKRTKSWNYSLMNLKAWINNADFAAGLGFDLWNYKEGNQIYLKSMIDWYLPYLKHEKDWTWKQIATGDLNGIKEVLVRAAEMYPEDKDEYLSVSNNLTQITTTTGGIIK